MDSRALFVLLSVTAIVAARETKDPRKDRRSIYGEGFGYSLGGISLGSLNSLGDASSGISLGSSGISLGSSDSSLGSSDLAFGASLPSSSGVIGSPSIISRHITVTNRIAVPVAQPYPVTVERTVPVPVPHPVHVPVSRPYPVPVPHPVPVPVERPVAVPVDKPVPYAVPHPVAVPVPRPVAVPVPRPVAVPVYKNVPVPVPHLVPVHKPVFVGHAGLPSLSASSLGLGDLGSYLQGAGTINLGEHAW